MVHSGLLDGMCQFVGEQALADCCLGSEMALCEHDIVPHHVCRRANGRGRGGGSIIEMHADSAEIVPEVRLHKSTGWTIEWLARGCQNLVHNWGNSLDFSPPLGWQSLRFSRGQIEGRGRWVCIDTAGKAGASLRENRFYAGPSKLDSAKIMMSNHGRCRSFELGRPRIRPEVAV
jgi:hypothetical protein